MNKHFLRYISTTCGTNMFKYKQSSLPIIFLVINTSYCKHILPSENALKTPDHPGCLTGA